MIPLDNLFCITNHARIIFQKNDIFDGEIYVRRFVYERPGTRDHI
jgi:hypothetical protein